LAKGSGALVQHGLGARDGSGPGDAHVDVAHGERDVGDRAETLDPLSCGARAGTTASRPSAGPWVSSSYTRSRQALPGPW
jgi:hypothetical protein